MSRPDLTEIVSAVLAELGPVTSRGMARGPGGRPEVPMRRGVAENSTAAASSSAPAASWSAPASSSWTAAARSPASRPAAAPGATPPVTVAEATACSPGRPVERGTASADADGATPPQPAGLPRRQPRRPSGMAAATHTARSDPAAAAGNQEAVQRIVADLRHRLDDPARG